MGFTICSKIVKIFKTVVFLRAFCANLGENDTNLWGLSWDYLAEGR